MPDIAIFLDGKSLGKAFAFMEGETVTAFTLPEAHFVSRQWMEVGY